MCILDLVKYGINNLSCPVICNLINISSIVPFTGFSQNAAIDENIELGRAKESIQETSTWKLPQVCLLICLNTHLPNKY